MQSEEILVDNSRQIKMSRVWAMPSMHTFLIPPIAKLIHKYVGDGKGWIDPFAGENSPAEFTNDLNPNKPAKYKLHAFDFIQSMNGRKFNGVLFDPPYSLTQVKEVYNSIGIELMNQKDAQYFPGYIKDAIAPKINGGGLALSFGWDSTGFGMNRGFEKLEIMLICHGGHHADTIVTVERKFQNEIF